MKVKQAQEATKMHIRKLAANLVREELESIPAARVQGAPTNGSANGNGNGHSAEKENGLGRHRDDKNLLSYMGTF